jgi:hypothetical protein
MSLNQLTKCSIYIWWSSGYFFFLADFSVLSADFSVLSADSSFHLIWLTEMDIRKTEWVFMWLANLVYIWWSSGFFLFSSGFFCSLKRFFSWFEWCLYLYILLHEMQRDAFLLISFFLMYRSFLLEWYGLFRITKMRRL